MLNRIITIAVVSVGFTAIGSNPVFAGSLNSHEPVKEQSTMAALTEGISPLEPQYWPLRLGATTSLGLSAGCKYRSKTVPLHLLLPRRSPIRCSTLMSSR